jgi:hypothetical protein
MDGDPYAIYDAGTGCVVDVTVSLIYPEGPPDEPPGRAD